MTRLSSGWRIKSLFFRKFLTNKIPDTQYAYPTSYLLKGILYQKLLIRHCKDTQFCVSIEIQKSSDEMALREGYQFTIPNRL
jgi:hypothetical protein